MKDISSDNCSFQTHEVNTHAHTADRKYSRAISQRFLLLKWKRKNKNDSQTRKCFKFHLLLLEVIWEMNNEKTKTKDEAKLKEKSIKSQFYLIFCLHFEYFGQHIVFLFLQMIILHFIGQWYSELIIFLSFFFDFFLVFILFSLCFSSFRLHLVFCSFILFSLSFSFSFFLVFLFSFFVFAFYFILSI